MSSRSSDIGVMRAWKPRFSVRTMLLATFVIAASLGSISIYPRSKVMLRNNQHIGYYTGLGLFDDNTLLGYRFSKYTIDDSPHRQFEIRTDGTQYGLTEARYPNGELALEGRCVLEGRGQNRYPRADLFDWAVSYRPDGSVAGVVRDGSGKCYLFYPSGHVQFEWELKDRERLYFKVYGEDGKLQLAKGNIPKGSAEQR